MKRAKTHKAIPETGRTQGFALLELMVALLILSLGILAFMQMQVTTIETNSFARHMTERTMMGTDRLEKLMALPYEALAENSTTTEVDGRYTITWQVSAANSPIQNVKTINVTASWKENGETRSMTYVYYKADQI